VPWADIILAGRQRDQLVHDVGQVRGPQVGFYDRQQITCLNGTLPPQNGPCRIKRAARRAVTRPDEHGQRFERGRVGGVGGQLKQAVDQDRAEQLRRAARGIEDLAGSPLLLTRGRPGARSGTVDPVQCLSQIADGITLSGQKQAAALGTLTMTPSPFVSGLLRRRVPRYFLSSSLLGDRGQGGHFARGIPVRTADAVRLVELDRKIQRHVTLGPGWRRMLAPHFKQAHRESQSRAHGTVAADTLDPSMTAVAPGQLDGLGVCLAYADRLVELPLSAHQASRPDADDKSADAPSCDAALITGG
jgi:hypothetical protein